MSALEQLKQLNETLGAPSVAKLLAAARKKKIPATRAMAEEVKDSVRQLFAKPLVGKGAIAANDKKVYIKQIWRA